LLEIAGRRGAGHYAAPIVRPLIVSPTLPVIAPLLPVLTQALPRGAPWCYEVKLDGFRGTLYLDRGAAGFRSKTQRPMPRFTTLAERIAAELPVRDAILDGEIVVMGRSGPQFNALLFNRGVPQFAAFDLVWLNGRDLRPWPYERRKGALQRLIAGHKWVSLIESYAEAELFDLVTEMDLEGVVAKRLDEPYAAATQWRKVKNRHYTQAIGRWRFFERRFVSAAREEETNAWR
jgi:bifunctional non-homologous end joining protein LigD